MENRAFVVLFNGNEIPDNVISRILREISTWCQADAEKTSIYTLNENDITKTIMSNIMSKCDPVEKCKPCDDAIKVLSDMIDLNCSVPLFAINISTLLMATLDRGKTIGYTKRDKKFLDAFRTLGQGGPRTTKYAEKQYYTKEKDVALREIYNRIFDGNGKIKE